MAAMEGDGDRPVGEKRVETDEPPGFVVTRERGRISPGLGAASPALYAFSRSTIRSMASCISGRSARAALAKVSSLSLNEASMSRQ